MAEVTLAVYRQHDDPHLYDLVINTAVLALDGVVDQICLALEQRASRWSLPIEARGPATGLQRYPGQVAEDVVAPSEPSSRF